MDYLVITEKYNDYFFPYVKESNIDIFGAYRIHNKLENLVMRVMRKLNIDFSIFLTSRNLKKNYDCIVFFDCSCDHGNLPLLRGGNKDVRLFIWNLFDDFIGRLRKGNPDIDVDYIKGCFDHVYSFDKNDCQKYGLEYYPPLYADMTDFSANQVLYDAVFLGTEKGRYGVLKSVYDALHQEGYEQLYHIYKSDAEYIDAHEFTVTSKKVSYNQYLQWVLKSRAIIDIPQKNQVGFTIRVMESLFLKKKLITTCRDIKNYKIYNPNNIFIIGEDDYASIGKFMSQEYEADSENILQYYSISTWLKNMKQGIKIDIGI